VQCASGKNMIYKGRVNELTATPFKFSICLLCRCPYIAIIAIKNNHMQLYLPLQLGSQLDTGIRIFHVQFRSSHCRYYGQHCLNRYFLSSLLSKFTDVVFLRSLGTEFHTLTKCTLGLFYINFYINLFFK